MLNRSVWLAFVVACAATAPERTPAQVVLDEGVQFGDVDVGPGIYGVERADDAHLRLVPEEGAAVLVAATSGTHEEVATPAAHLLGGDAESERHIVLLLDGGGCLEAVGYIGGVRPRGGMILYSKQPKSLHKSLDAKTTPVVKTAAAWKIGSKQTISWSDLGPRHQRVTLSLYRGKRFVRTIRTRAKNTGKHGWIVPELPAADDYRVLVTGAPGRGARNVPRAFSAPIRID